MCTYVDFCLCLCLGCAPLLARRIDELHVTLCILCVGSSTSFLEMCCTCVIVHTPFLVLVFPQSPGGVLNEPFPVKDAVSGAGDVVGVVVTLLSFWLLNSISF